MRFVIRAMGHVDVFRAARRCGWSLPLLLVGVAGTPALAQRDSQIVRTVSTWQRDVDRLTKELLDERRIEGEFLRMLAGIESRLRTSASDSLRSEFQAQGQLIVRRLREAGSTQLRIRRDLESMCSSVRKPEGWLGIATTGFSVVDRQGDGPQVVHFMEPPVVESVDPGSPADRVGLRTGDILIEIGEQPLLRRDVVFAELLRPGQYINVKVQRGRQIVVVKPMIEPVPAAMSRTPCSLVDAGTAYVLAPAPGESAFQVEVTTEPDAPERKFVFTAPGFRLRRDSAAVVEAPVSGVFVGPMAQYFTGGLNPVAGLQIVPVNPDLGRTFGVDHGLFVIQVLPGTPGRNAGLRGGDVLLSANDVELRSASTLQRVISQSDRRVVTLIIVRDKKTEKVTLRW